jgi:GNAT superfamily N-acetyltransferase
MVRPSRERVSVPSLPPGYTLRTFRDGDELAYAELFRLAWPDVGTLQYTRAHALPSGFLLLEHDSTAQLAASCVAFEPESPRHRDDGSLGWLVVDAAHGRRGLATVIAATATNRLLDEGYALPWLGTEDDRLVALGIYLSLGWLAYLYTEGMEARWREIFARLERKFSLSDCVSL